MAKTGIWKKFAPSKLSCRLFFFFLMKKVVDWYLIKGFFTLGRSWYHSGLTDRTYQVAWCMYRLWFDTSYISNRLRTSIGAFHFISLSLIVIMLYGSVDIFIIHYSMQISHGLISHLTPMINWVFHKKISGVLLKLS